MVDESDSDDGYSSEDEGQDSTLSTEAFLAKWDQIESQLSSESSLQDVRAQNRFFDEFDSVLQPQRRSFQSKHEKLKRNLLHSLAAQDSPFTPYSWLVKGLVMRYPALLDEVDVDGRGPLHAAIKHERYSFVKAMLNCGIDTDHLQKAVGKRSANEENCVHAAIFADCPADMAIKLIENASSADLSTQDSRGLTPLHLAVEYKRCKNDRLGVLRALLTFGDKALDCWTKDGKLSVHQYYQQEYSKQRHSKKQGKTDKLPEGSQRKEHKHLSSKSAEGKEKSQREERSGKLEKKKKDLPKTENRNFKEPNVYLGPTKDSQSPVLPRRAPTLQGSQDSEMHHPIAIPLHYQANETRRQMLQKNAVEIPLSLTENTDIDAKATEMPRAEESPEAASTKASVQRKSAAKRAARRFDEEVKLHYFRSIFRHQSDKLSNPTELRASLDTIHGLEPRSPEDAERFLFGEDRGDQKISLRFPASDRKDYLKIKFDMFKKAYSNFKFEPVLLYAYFGRLILDKSASDFERRETTHTGIGRRDMIEFFGWLREQGVRMIVKVIVEDREQPHSDDAVEEALKDFKIEILDWRKLDLCPRTILDACDSHLQEVHLWWSGNNAVLRSWSDPDGLVQLRNLRCIHLHLAKDGLESKARTDRNIKDFKDRLGGERSVQGRKARAELGLAADLDTDWRPIFVHVYKPEDHHQVGRRRQRDPKGAEIQSNIRTHKWLQTMDAFADGIANLKNPSGVSEEDFLKNEQLPESLRKDVRVALIDDGVDILHRALVDKIDNGKSFESGLEYPELGGAFDCSTTGHGTCMAYMIGRVCPRVKIYVCKLDVCRGEGGRANFTARSAVEAIQLVMKRGGFDIMSISWTVKPDSDAENQRDIGQLRQAITEAAQSMLVFCSAPDIGVTSASATADYLPFGMSADIFKIGAAKADGHIYGLAGTAENVEFILPGHNVEVRHTDKSIDEAHDSPKTGSSVATALAAGLAALVIHCVRLGAIYGCYQRARGENVTTAVSPEALKAIKRFKAMKGVFHRLAGGNTKRVDVEPIFKFDDRGFGIGAPDDNELKWECVAGIVRDLVSWRAQQDAKSGGLL